MVSNPEPKDSKYADYVFLTCRGLPWTSKGKTGRDNPISKEMAKLLKHLGIHRAGVGFYALRHTFQTVAEKTLDKEAVRCIMGHAENANDTT
jgi:hypothetical protein